MQPRVPAPCLPLRLLLVRRRARAASAACYVVSAARQRPASQGGAGAAPPEHCLCRGDCLGGGALYFSGALPAQPAGEEAR